MAEQDWQLAAEVTAAPLPPALSADRGRRTELHAALRLPPQVARERKRSLEVQADPF